MRNRPVENQRREIHHLWFIQGVGADGAALDMPDDGESFDTIYLVDKTYSITKIRAFTTAGTWTAQIKLDDALVGNAFSEDADFPIIITPSIFYAGNKPITLQITESADVEGFFCDCTLLEV